MNGISNSQIRNINLDGFRNLKRQTQHFNLPFDDLKHTAIFDSFCFAFDNNGNIHH